MGEAGRGHIQIDHTDGQSKYKRHDICDGCCSKTMPGPFKECRAIAKMFDGRCANCVFVGKDCSLSGHVTKQIFMGKRYQLDPSCTLMLIEVCTEHSDGEIMTDYSPASLEAVFEKRLQQTDRYS